jgi:dihydrodipicolinate synthase/N-acetylneuraminate lyase
VRYAQAAEKAGADGLMLLPPMVYVPKAHELVNHFKGVAKAWACRSCSTTTRPPIAR